jgi:SAM-dependent methyltransferase
MNPANQPASSYDWTAFFDAVRNLPPRETLLMALKSFDAEAPADSPRQAVDLGCGEGRDTAALLHSGWRVMAVDAHAEGLRRTAARTPWPQLWRLTTVRATFEDVRIDPSSCDLVNASFAIPHCDPADFPALWAKLAAAIRPGGRFAGQLFGVNDSFARNSDGITRTYHTRSQVEDLLQSGGLIPEHLDEVERPGKTALGEDKYWHVFHIVARKDGSPPASRRTAD